MKTRRTDIIVLLLCVGFLFACEESAQVKEITQRTAAASVPAAKVVWPPPPKDDKSVVVASNLLAQNYYVVFDSSGSMAERACGEQKSKSELAKAALKVFAQNVRDDANLGLLIFDGDGVRERMMLRLAKDGRANFVDHVQNSAPGDGTPLDDAVSLGYKRLEEQAQAQLGYGEYHLVIVTDGEANVGHDPSKVVHYIVSQTPVVIHTIGFCIGSEHSLNQPGKTIYKEAKDLESLKAGLKEVLAESPVFDPSDFSNNQ